MNTTALRLEQLSGKAKTGAARKAAVKSRATKTPAKTVKKRKPTTSELIIGLRKFKWDFDAMKRV